VTPDEWVQQAIDAAVEQGYGVGIEDPEVVDFIAGMFLQAAQASGRDAAA
jgi:hypothetical protein